MNTFDEARFQASFHAALARIKTLLDNTRNPQLPADVAHTWDDKYLLAEFLTRTATAAVIQCLGGLGLTTEGVAQLSDWAKTRSVTLRLQAHETCTFLREETRTVESAQQHVSEWRGVLGGTRTDKIVTTVKEYFWSFEFRYDLLAFQGNTAEQGVTLHGRSGRIELKTAAKTPPRLESVVRAPLDVNVTWLFAHLDAQSRVAFAIDRAATDCHTPRRNTPVASALGALYALRVWSHQVQSYFLRDLFSAQTEHALDLSAIHARGVFVPVVPLFEEPRGGEAQGVIPVAYANTFLAEQRRSLAERCAELARVFPRDSSVITAVEASLLVTLAHAADVCLQYNDGVELLESMLRKQLVAAIGKDLTPADFTAYMDFHHRKLFKPEYRPQPFSYAVRRPDHSPEGVVSLESALGGADRSPVATAVSHRAATRPMGFALDAATRVSFLGDRYLHAWVAHQFSGEAVSSLELVARARQFSSFIVLVGRIASADTFEPRHAIIVQNKDELAIPLLLEQIPTPAEFRDAIESLSPEQQRFAKAFRAMQLESTLFGVCVIQIKPQLERLLGLNDDSLTKEIKLTQDLLTLFMEYQIPSDLLSYDGPRDATPADKLARVKDHVAKMHAMIEHSKQRELDEAREREALRLAEMNLSAPPPPPPMRTRGMAPLPSAPNLGGGPPMPLGAMPVMAPAMAPPSMAPGGGGPPPPAPAPAPSASAPMPPPAAKAAPAPVVATAPAPQTAPAPKPPTSAAHHDATASEAAVSGDVIDYTRIPTELDRRFEEIDEDSALRPTILNVGPVWRRRAQKGLLGDATTSSLARDAQRTEQHKAFDLLDALSRSGALPIEQASLHVVIAATHCFDKTLVDVVIEDNVNPIEKVERSVMIVATTVHDRPAHALLADDQRARFFAGTPRLGLEAASDGSAPEAPEAGI